MLSFIPIKR